MEIEQKVSKHELFNKFKKSNIYKVEAHRRGEVTGT